MPLKRQLPSELFNYLPSYVCKAAVFKQKMNLFSAANKENKTLNE